MHCPTNMSTIPLTQDTVSGLASPTSRPRPGSLILTPGSMDGQGVGVPELSVIRIFAGDHLETEATFKTVLLNASTTAGDLVRQAIQRFRLPAGDDAGDYFLTVKQVEGGASAALRADEPPLGVFESLVEAALEMPKVKRSSMASISSVASNLSMHPAISSLNMNDFTDDSAVKFYLNRRRSEGAESSEVGEEDMDDTLIADMSHGDASMDSTNGQGRGAYLTVSTNNGNVPPERFSSPSFRFPLQGVIYPEDLPEDMVFDPQTEAIVFKNTIRDRAQAGPSPGVPQNMRRKVFIFPKNVTVAEVIELGLERFGILEGVVDGGDEVEDKMTKRRSMARVRYGLSVNTGGSENKELSPSSKVIDAFPRPPAYRTADKRDSQSKRRSMDSAMLLGTVDDVAPDDPVFVLRRSVTYRNSTAKHRISGALDEIALQKLYRELSSSVGSDHKPGPSGASGPSKAEIIAAQHEAKRANQRAILSAQTNSVRGVDVLLPGNAIIRSTRQDMSDKMRYSYVDQDGESYDISDIVAEEWRNHGAGAGAGSKDDALEGVLVRNKEGMAKLERAIGKIQKGKEPVGRQQPRTSAGSSEYSFDAPTSSTIEDPSRAQSSTPISSASRMTTPIANDPKPSSRPGTTTPTAPRNRCNPSAASVLSDISRYATRTSTWTRRWTSACAP
ncbi:hypothetical protein BD626DRAFT_256499 [Schizophyllum amplum]|uniref:Ras-associating domain-containing protein n=1 Tax=Schizophyllum amplum TaxID=97359 RepID=A0A550BUT9_9AGAR|nr:hypothetical protein BD626DRAFT_256499 [Auriculariopsis ampla]